MSEAKSVEITAMAIINVTRETTMGHICDVPIPRTRGGHQTQVFERYHRRRDELDGVMSEMFVKGVSTTKVGEVIETLTGSHRSRLHRLTNQSMLNAIGLKFAESQRQRCVIHKMENVLSYVPQKQRELVEPELKALFYQNNRQEADQAVAAFIEKYQRMYPTAIACLQRDLDACLTFYSFPKAHWKTIRTNNIIERLFVEVKRRSHKMAAAFRNEDSCILLFYAVIRSLRFNNLTMPAASQAQPDQSNVHTT